VCFVFCAIITMLNMEEGITFTWANLNVSTSPQEGKRCCGLLKSEPKPSKKILQNVSGVARPGEVLAIMGASRAGKSTFLNMLLFRNMQGLNVG
jgi:ABC-type multidrug transport system ATPase subunit